MEHNECSSYITPQICCGASNSLFLTSAGSVYSYQESLGLRRSSADNSHSTQPADQATKLDSLHNVTYIECDQGYCIALCSDGKLHSWGRNDFGQVNERSHPPYRLNQEIINLDQFLIASFLLRLNIGFILSRNRG